MELYKRLTALVNDVLDIPMNLCGIELKKRKKDGGEIETSVEIVAEVPKGTKYFSKCRITVKCPEVSLPVTNADLETDDYNVVFENLQVSMVSNFRCYLRADAFHITREEN